MSKSIVEIQEYLVSLLGQAPDGLRHSELVTAVSKWDPSIPEGTIFGSMHTLPSDRVSDVFKPSRGLYQLTKFKSVTITMAPPSTSPAIALGVGGVADPSGHATAPAPLPSPPLTPGEDVLYEPFADFLVNGVEECTKAIALGGNSFGTKWGTPDVIGILRARESHIYKPTMEVVSAEIKTDSSQLVVAFGQACAYTQFSHRVYLVIPIESPKEDVDRLTSLCQIFGIGLVLANASATPPVFNAVLRAARHEPDAYYVNQNLPKVESKLLH
ncbi:MAG: hypothetical protein L3K07_04035 [Thermoplasmata archaeon]|nr:hypothetical protein [Thermoplasmata archaeon]